MKGKLNPEEEEAKGMNCVFPFFHKKRKDTFVSPVLREDV